MATKKPKQVKTPPAPKRPVRSVPIADLDTTYADAVRAGERDELHVQRLKKAYEDGAPVPPVVAVTWPGSGRYFLADGGYRRLAKLELKEPNISAEVVEFPTEYETRQGALKIAAGANEHPGKTRSPDDVRAAVIAYITAGWNARASDRSASKAINCCRLTVRTVRLELSDNGTIPVGDYAHAWHPSRGLKDESVQRGGHIQLKDGSIVPSGDVNRIGRATTPSDGDRPATSRILASASEEAVRLSPSPAAPPAESVPVIRREPPTPMPVAEKPTDEELLLRHLDDCRPHVGRLFQQLHYAASTAFGLMVLNEEAARLGLVLEEGQPQVGDRFGKVVGVGIRCDVIEGICNLIDAADARVRAALAKQTVHA